MTTEQSPDRTAPGRASDLAREQDAPELPEVDPVPSFDEVATQYGPTIYQIAYRLTGDDEEARDLAQDVFVRVYRNLDKYEPGTFTGWLYRVTKNLFLDRVRRRGRIRIETLPDEDWREPVDATPGPADRVEQGVLRGDIERAIVTLPPTFRTAVVLCDVQGLTYDEISDATGWPLGTVRSRIHRGRKLLRAALTEDGGVERGSERGVERGSEPGVERGSEPGVERGSERGSEPGDA